MILLHADPSPVYALRFSPDGARLVAGTKSGGLTFFEHLSLSPEVPQSCETAVHAIDFSPSGAWVATATGLGWFARSASGHTAYPERPSRGVTGVQFVSETLLAVGIGDRSRPGAGQIELWDLERKRPREPKLTAPEGVRALDANCERRRIAWVEWGRRAGVWDVETATPFVIPLPQVPGAIALNTTADRIAVAMKWSAAVYDLTTRQEQFQLKGHKGILAALVFGGDSRHIITGGWDHTVKFWDASRGLETASYDFGVGRVTSLALSPDGLQLAVGGEAGAICVFDVT